MDWTEYFSFDKEQWFWVLQVFLIILLSALASFFAKRFLSKLVIKLGRTSTRWDDIIIAAMSKPITWLIWVIGLSQAISLIAAKTENSLFGFSKAFFEVGVLLCITWFVIGFIRGAEQEFTDNSDRVDKTTAEALSKLVRLAVWITSALVILQTLGFSVSGVLAMGGVGGIAIGFAAKDLLANFFGGLMIYLDRPFAIGDWIRSPDRKIEGTVEKIGWRVSVVRNFESQPMYIPNSIFTSIIVENPSRMANRRIHETFGLRYSDLGNMKKIVADVEAMLIAHAEIDANKTMIINFNEFSDSSVDFFVYCFTNTTQWIKYHQVKQQVLLQIAQVIELHGAEIAFPTTSIQLAESLNTAKDAQHNS